MKIQSLLLVTILCAVLPLQAFAVGGSPTSRFGVGFATTDKVDFAQNSATAWIDFGIQDSLQFYLGLPSTSPTLFSAAAIYKHTVAESSGAGLHLGGGLGLGSLPANQFSQTRNTGHVFGMSLMAVAGFHFPIPGATNVMAQIEGGPNLQVVDGNSDFSISALSSALGLSVLYFF